MLIRLQIKQERVKAWREVKLKKPEKGIFKSWKKKGIVKKRNKEMNENKVRKKERIKEIVKWWKNRSKDMIGDQPNFKRVKKKKCEKKKKKRNKVKEWKRVNIEGRKEKLKNV